MDANRSHLGMCDCETCRVKAIRSRLRDHIGQWVTVTVIVAPRGSTLAGKDRAEGILWDVRRTKASVHIEGQIWEVSIGQIRPVDWDDPELPDRWRKLLDEMGELRARLREMQELISVLRKGSRQ